MSKELKTDKLGNIGRVSMCKRIMKHQTSSSEIIPFYKISTFGGSTDTFISREIYDQYRSKYSYPKKGDILISAAGTVGKTVIYDGSPSYFQDSNIVWIDNDESKILNAYLYYFYQTKPWIMTDGSTIKRLYNDNLRDLKITFPESLQAQKKIAYILSTLDSKIELNNRINSELEKMAKTLYDYWFVQFDFPDENGKPYKSSGGKMIFDEKLKRDIPEGWEAEKMNELINTNNSGDWGKEEKNGNYTEKVVCIRGADINGLNGKGELNPPTRYILQKNSNKILKPHDLIIEISGGSPTQSTGRMAFITNATIKRFQNPLICSNFCKPISLKNEKFLYNFAYYWDSVYENNILFRYEGKTSGIKNLLLESLTASCYLVIPEKKILNKFYNLMENINTNKQLNLEENQKLAELRDWLLPMLMNGQVEVE